VKIVRNIAIAVLVILIIVLVFLAFGTSTVRARALQIKIGDSKNGVRSVLGEPTESSKTSGLGILFNGGAAEWWSYGSLLEFPWLAPMKFHLLGPGTNDIAVYFDSAGKVTRVYVPKT
jgi:outer membrane protein assembly factor BamE (lipoprotein component of BamABCDE complex)